MPKYAPDLAKTAQDVTRTAQEAAYVAVGLGILGFQKAQVRRNELVKRFGDVGFDSHLAEARKVLSERVKELDGTVTEVIKVLDSRFEPVEKRLPAGAQAVVAQARDARDQLRSRLAALAA